MRTYIKLNLLGRERRNSISLTKKGLSAMVLACCFLVSACKDDEAPEVIDEGPAIADQWKAGETYYAENEYTEVRVGDVALVISVPHGGYDVPDDIPDRTCPGISVNRDGYTIELAEAIEAELIEKYNIRPYVVVSNIARLKVDQNRDLAEGTCGNQAAVKPWEDFHNYLDTAVRTAADRHGRVLYIDLHGHGHANQRLEMGYSLTISDLTKAHAGTDLPMLAAKSSLNNLFKVNSKYSLRDLMVGADAFGTLMADEGIPSVPSKQDPYPKAGDPFFTGGYNSRYYTSSDYPDVYGWQIECNSAVRTSEAGREAFAKAFGKAITQFMDNVEI